METSAQQALRLGVELLGAEDPEDRATGCDLLGDAGNQHAEVRTEAATALVALAGREQEGCVLARLARALEYLDDPRSIPVLAELSWHPDPEVRVMVPNSFTPLTGPEPDGVAVRTLIRLTRDEDDEVRNWAAFVLGFQLEVDSAEIRAALWERTTDPYGEAREEGIRGLARRHDLRAVPLVAELLHADEGAHWHTFAAAQYLGVSELLPYLDEYEPDSFGVPEAVAACDPALRERQDADAWELLHAVHRLCPEFDPVLYQDRFEHGLKLGSGLPAATLRYSTAALLERAGGDPQRAAELVAAELVAADWRT
ncbi:HEAT repeat domain-containing protein [Streptacidiphilus sp. N1-12]|uniref:HEAT repeat domain-containing protein n=2 Tax=Streptacidiphilus alkalitolerans TaxID=3342712 RepID=A0ABV6W7A8_9ACTN